jgi:hypothetical protein
MRSDPIRILDAPFRQRARRVEHIYRIGGFVITTLDPSRAVRQPVPTVA